jgi:hypothetical protein
VQLEITRLQATRRFLSVRPRFQLSARLILTADEQALFTAFGLGRESICERPAPVASLAFAGTAARPQVAPKQQQMLHIYARALVRGTVLSCATFSEMAEVESSLRAGCLRLKALLGAVSAFTDRSVIEI